jgi:hypothetical protein
MLTEIYVPFLIQAFYIKPSVLTAVAELAAMWLAVSCVGMVGSRVTLMTLQYCSVIEKHT